MNVVQSPPVQIAIRTLSEEDRRRIWAWFDHLRNWENDSFVREHSEKLPSSTNVYVLKTTNDVRIFFRLEDDQIEILDIATKATIMSSGRQGAGR
jgi:hypothetical protein